MPESTRHTLILQGSSDGAKWEYMGKAPPQWYDNDYQGKRQDMINYLLGIGSRSHYKHVRVVEEIITREVVS